MKTLPNPSHDTPIPSALHLEFIRTVVDAGEGDETGASAVEDFHRALFLQHHGRDLERCRQDRRSREESLDGLESRLRHTRSRLEGVDPFLAVVEEGVADDRPTASWNAWNGGMFVVAAVAILCLLAFGVSNVSFNLLESGIVTFSENPIRAYLWAALLPVGALAVKVGWDFLKDRRKRDAYLWSCLILGMLGVLAWVATYASIYPSLSRTTAEQINSLSVFDGPGPDRSGSGPGLAGLVTSRGVKVIDMILVASQAVAEIFLSAVLGIYMTQLYARHRPVRLADNPVYRRFDEERRFLEDGIARERQALAQASGEEVRLENQLTVFVSYARSLFQREIAARRDWSHRKQLLIEEMATELRSRLDALDGDPDRDAFERPPELQGNGSARRLNPVSETRA